jgi:glutamyl-tRNA synthetase
MVRTRFAPSPTGYLHIGGVRTALFNWLFARRHGGRFVLRIDDTDEMRNVEAALQPILDGFRWLGLDWDEGPEVGGDFGPYRQSERTERHREAARTLVERGLAYTDYATPDEIQAERGAAQAEGKRFLYSRAWMAKTPQERSKFESEGRKALVRLEMPREGTCTFVDAVRGEVSFDWAREQDHVIQRADGSCLYHLASVVDDHDMEISHVIRAEEHLSNTPRQIFIAEGLGFEPPTFAHLPFVAAPGGKNKLSKRKLEQYRKNPDFARVWEHGNAIAAAIGHDASADTFNPVIVDFYETVGYLPGALLNYLLLLGWSLDDKTEFFTRDEMVQHFGLERVGKGAASFDPAKLAAFQDHYMQELPLATRVEMTLTFLEGAGLVAAPVAEADRDRAGRIVEAAGDRIKVAGDVLDYRHFFRPATELAWDDRAFAKRLEKPDAAARLERLRERFATADEFEVGAVEEIVRSFVEAEGIKMGDIIHALRVAVTGTAVGFGMFETLAILGRDECLARIDAALARVSERKAAGSS